MRRKYDLWTWLVGAIISTALPSCAPVCQAGDATVCTCQSGDMGVARCSDDGSSYGACACPRVCEPGQETDCICRDGDFQRTTCLPDGSGFEECPCDCTPGTVAPCSCSDSTAGERACEDDGKFGYNCSCASNNPDASAEACEACSIAQCADQRAACDSDASCLDALQCYQTGMAAKTCPGVACALVCELHSGFTGKLVALTACESKRCSTACERLQGCGMVNQLQVETLAKPDDFPDNVLSCLATRCCEEGLSCGEDIECIDAFRHFNVGSDPDLGPSDASPNRSACIKYDELVRCANVCFDHWPLCQ